MGVRVGNVDWTSRLIGSFFDTIVVVGSAVVDVDATSSSAVPTLAVVSSTCSEEEPLPKRSFSFPTVDA